MENVIEISRLNKSFKDVKAVQDLSFRVKRGELFAFLGVNGAGKSTTINILCGQLEKDSGSVVVDGVDLDKDEQGVKSKLGVVFQQSVLDKDLTVFENLESRAALYGILDEAFDNRLQELSKLLDLEGLLNRVVGKLSGGQRRRIDIARALLHKPEILILDEPTTGLDPQTRKLLWGVVETLRKSENMTVFLTTHYMEEASEADFVVILDGGKIAAEGTPLQLKNRYTGDYLTLYNVSEEEVERLALPFVKVANGYKISIPNTKTVTKLILENPKLFKDYEVVKGKMDDVFLSVTGKALSGEKGGQVE